MHPSVQLFQEMRQVEPYPMGVKPIPEQIQSTAFFPGGYGLWLESNSGSLPEFPYEGIMVIGRDFDSEANYRKTLSNPRNNQTAGTWKNITRFFKEIPLPMHRCFFTNAYMGLREGTESKGNFPGAMDSGFVDRCRSFLRRQIEVQKPRLILALGMEAPQFLGLLCRRLRPWSTCTATKDFEQAGQLFREVDFGIPGHKATVVFLVHPSYRHINARHRSYNGYSGNPAEVALVRNALRSNLAI